MHENGKSGFEGIVLAAGTSSRFGGENKLLAEVHGMRLVRRTVLSYLGAGLDRLVVVTGFGSDEVVDALSGLPIECVLNARFLEGQSTSLHVGIRALSAGTIGAVVGVADQLHLRSDTVRRLVLTAQRADNALVVPRYGGQRGNPVVFPAALFPELLAVTGDVGGRPVIDRHRENIVWIDFDDPSLGADVDLPSDLSETSDLD
jgi:molybdenum cofactor cytidylyltransferase